MDGLRRMSDYTNGGVEAGFGSATAAADYDHVLMNSFFVSGMPPYLHKTHSILDFKNAFGSRTSNFPMVEQVGFGTDLTEYESDDSTAAAAGQKPQHGCRKRLSVHQVHCLEKCFKVDSKLEPRRKADLARELGLKTRQVAIWFQNRRARHKNKQIEKDYDKVAAQYGTIKAQYDKVINENKKLKAQMKSMKEEMSLLKDSLLKYGKLTMLSQPQVLQVQAEPQLMQQTQPELQQEKTNEFNNVCNRGMIEQQHQQVISPASSVFDSNSPVVKPKSKLLASADTSYHGVEPAKKRSTSLMQGAQENSVNQELSYDLPHLFDLDEQNCFYSSQFDGPPISNYNFGDVPTADDPFWQSEF